ncbi:MAG TPA: FAD-binding protein [Anaerolineae bacterium]|nr:FAD-binding protein [Anaerolineae bacterium]
MLEKRCDVAVIGSGPAGLAAAIAAKEAGAQDVVVIERDVELGGILLQCIHNGFGLEIFKEDLTGPEYAYRFIERAKEVGVETLLDTMVLDLTPHREIYAINKRYGMIKLDARAVVLAMGCRERPRGALAIPGTRPAGIYTAGTAQRLIEIEGYMPGERFVILGSGDIGMIMARRLVFEGAKVERMIEILPYVSGLMRNYVQCVLDYDIPLELSHTVIEIRGRNRVEAVVSAQVDENWRPIPGTEEVIPCDTLMLSVGLIPENELSKKAGVELDPLTGGPYVDERMMTNIPGIFAAGNVVHVYDLVDWVTRAGYLAGRHAGEYAIQRRKESERKLRVVAGDNVHHVVPHVFDPLSLEREPQELQLRVRRPVEAPVWVKVEADGRLVKRKTERYVRPSEMIMVKLSPEDHDKIVGAKELSVRVEEKE